MKMANQSLKTCIKNASMTNLIIILGLLLGLGGMIIYVRRQDRKTGQNEQKLEHAEEAIENVKKSNRAESSDDHDDELREKYGRK